MSEDIGGHGSKSSNSIWLQYRAMKTLDGGQKVPFGKFTRGVKDDAGNWNDEEFTFVCGILQSVSLRENEGKPDKGVDPYLELIIVLGAVKDGNAYTYKLPFKAGSTAAMSLTRRLPSIVKGELVEVGAFVKDGGAAVAIQKYVGSNKVAIQPVDSQVVFAQTDGLTGAALKIARTQNEALREGWVIDTVKKLPYYEPWGTPPAPVVPVAADEYDPFSDE